MTDDTMTDETRVLAPDPQDRWRLVRVATEFLTQFGTRTDDGRKLVATWGEPDDLGVYEPTFTATDDGMTLVPTATLEALERVRDAARFRASTTFTHFDPQPEGPDLLEAIAAYMDRQDDAAEARDGVAKDRTVQADVRRWAAALRAALGGPT